MNTKAISPVIATVIIVSVAIAIAVAVAFWMTGITGLFTRYEKLEVISAYAVYDDTNIAPGNDNIDGGWNITVIVKNTGSSDATVDNIFINGKPFTVYGNDVLINGSSTLSESTITPGQRAVFVITLSDDVQDFSHGVIVEVKLHTAAGNEYPKSVQLP